MRKYTLLYMLCCTLVVQAQMVWHEAYATAGICTDFYSDAQEIGVRFTMTPGGTAVGDVELYATDSDGKTARHAYAEHHTEAGTEADTLCYYFKGMTYHNQHRLGSEYHLYLPLNDCLSHIEIGIPVGSLFKRSAQRTERPIVIYGTAQDWMRTLQRQLDIPVFLNATHADARLYILSQQPQKADAEPWVKNLLAQSDAPILIVGGEGLQVDADSLCQQIADILDLHPLTDYAAVRQRREPATYEWNERHESVLQRHRTTPPDVLMIGNSITHYWAGEPSHRIHRNTEAWNRLFEGMTVTNMGFGWDRIENVLWRIQHGELDGVSPKHICLMIGTNNISIHEKPEKIARGITELAAAIRRRQPQARLHVLTVFPRKDMNAEVKAVNQLLTQMLRTDEHTDLIDLTPALTLPNGQIDPSLYGTDGLHPAARGYEKVADVLKKAIFQPN